MKYLLIAILVLNSNVSVASDVPKMTFDTSVVPGERTQASVDSELKKKFLKETKIELGEYERTKKSDKKCLDGELSIIDLEDELTLMLGARPLAAGIGKDKTTEKEGDNCNVTYENTYNDIAIKERVEQFCGKNTVVFHTTITLEKGKIAYVKEAYSGEKLVDTLKCVLVKKKK